LIENFDNHDIPISVLMLDKDWHIRPQVNNKRLRTGFTFNAELFKNPSDLVNRVHDLGIRIGVNVNPVEGFYPVDAFYETAKKYLQPNQDGCIPFNVYDPKTLDVYLKVFIHPLDNFGIDFFWIDWYDKTRVNDLALLKHYHFYDMHRGDKRRSMIYGYNPGVAAHRYPVLYAGKSIVSWETLANIPYFNGRAANIGVTWWSHDIGGYFNGTEDNELYERYIQLGTFSPILKLSADAGRFYKREPWRWDVRTYAIAGEYLTLRHRLIPYLYSEAYRYYKFGIPLIQPVYYQYPEIYDDVLYKNEYSFGSQFFICPIVTKKDPVMNRVIQKFFLPEGTWFNFRSGKKYLGNSKHISFFRSEEYPAFVKAGAIIPMAITENINDTTPPKNMEIQIFPGSSNSYKMYEDDGVSNLYLKGYSLTTLIDYNYLPNNYTVIIRPVEGKTGIVPATRNYTIRFRNTKRSNDVQAFIKATKIPVKTYIDGPDFIVELHDVSTTEQLTVNCKGKDIEIDAIRIVLEDVEEIISDLPLATSIKEMVFNLLIDKNLKKDKKRIEFKKLGKGKEAIDKKYIQLFLQLLEYIDQTKQ
jgi:alpha-glucosidase (family GH31 glycosyl hydrolase)